MLACIACSTKEGGEDGSRGAAATPHGGKSLTSQLKDMVLKFSGSGGRQYKAAGSPSFRSNRFHRSSRLAAYPGIIDDSGFTSDGAADGYTTYMRTTTSSTAARTAPAAAWDAAKVNRGFPQYVRSPSASWIHSIGEEDDDEEEAVVLEEDRVPREWTAQVEPGVQITFVSIPGGAGNDLKRIRFSREMFNKWEAQRWWGENYDRVVELYNVQTFSRGQGFSTPSSSVDDATQRDSLYSLAGSTRESPVMPPPPVAVGREQPIARAASCKAMAAASSATRATCNPSSTAVPDPSDHVWAHHFNLLNSAPAPVPPPFDASRPTTSSRDEASVSFSNASDLEATEWVEQDDPGVCITIREFGDGTRELRRVRFSRERFGEERAKVWWEQNRDRIHAQYL